MKLSKGRILVVEDGETSAIDLRAQLERWGFDVTYRSGSRGGLPDPVREGNPSLVLVLAPHEGGDNALEAGLSISSECHVPILVLAADQGTALEDRIGSMRNAMVLGIPFSERELDLALRVLMTQFELDSNQLSAKQHRAVFEIAEAALHSSQLGSLIESIHRSISGVIAARNFYVALLDADTETISFPYFVDECDARPADGPFRRGLTEYVFRTGKPLFASPQKFDELVASGDVESLGNPSVDWLGVPLLLNGEPIGVLAIQTYEQGIRYREEDLQFLQFVSTQVAVAIDRFGKEEALRNSESELRGLFQAMEDLVMILDGNGRYLTIAPTNPTILYKPAVDLLGKTLHEVFSRTQADYFLDQVQHALRFRTRVLLEYPLEIGPETRWFEAALTYAGPNRVVCIARDVTARRKIERRLREAQETYKGIFDHASMGIAQRTMEGVFTSVNPALVRMYGFADSDELLSDMNTRRGQRYKGRERARMIDHLLSERHEISDVESEVIRKDGSLFWIGENYRRIRTSAGDSAGYIVTIQDITSRKQAERELRLLANTVACAQDCFILTDLEGNVIFINEAFTHTFGYDSESVLGRPVSSLLVGNAGESEGVAAFRPVSGSWNGETSLARKDGTILPVEIWTSLVRDEVGQAVAFVSVARDISERKRAEEVLRLNETRLETLVALNQMTGASVERIKTFALEEGVALTSSEFGYLAFCDEHEGHISSWMASTRAPSDESSGVVVPAPLQDPLVLATVLDHRRPMMVNHHTEKSDRSGEHPSDSGTIRRYLAVPVFDGPRMVAVACVANKSTEYESTDATQLTLLMEGMWVLVQRERAQAQLVHSLDEKEVLLKEVHHRVKNNLQIISSLLNLELGKAADEATLEMLRESQNRIRSMALIHERLYRADSLSKVDFGPYVRNLISYLVRSYSGSGHHVHVQVSIENVLLGLDLAIPCGLIVNELVTNFLRYSLSRKREGNIVVGMTVHESVCRLTVRDNEGGSPGNPELTSASSLGLQLVETLVDQIDGVMEASHESGSEVHVIFRAG
jgi:PAS domain S-box-containing protein